MRKTVLHIFSILTVFALTANPALAGHRGNHGGGGNGNGGSNGGGGGGNSSTDVSVQVAGPATSNVFTNNTYSVTVANVGNATAKNITVAVTLPLTDTSPSVHTLGTVSNVDSRCQVVNNALACSVGNLKKNKNTTLTFDYNLPVSTKALSFTATVSTDTTDTNASNDTDTLTPVIAYLSVPFTSANVTNSHCTGQGLTSYFECLLFPSSISSHTAVFNGNGTITVPNHTGTWQLSNNNTQLNFEYSNLNGVVLQFEGFGINGNCFDGLTTFTNSTYVSPYRVCI